MACRHSRRPGTWQGGLREELAAARTAVSHAQALELIARQHGFRDRNALHVSVRDRPPGGCNVGRRVTGRHLSQEVTASVPYAEQLRPGWLRIDLDAAVDLVRYDRSRGRVSQPTRSLRQASPMR